VWQTNRGVAAGTVAAALVFAGLAGTILRWPRGPAPRALTDLDTAALGRAVLTEWVLAFEVLGVLLVAALLGALYLARTEE
jgi:NADH:ubiquinone oxidoreductase subunit 6 (subunit J)